MSPDKPNPLVYDTGASVQNVRQHFQPQVDLLEELSAYASNLLARIFTEPDRTLEHAVVLGCLFRQFLVNLDAVKVLVTAGAADSSLIHLRAMIEELFYVKWLIKEDTAHRAKCFYVWNVRQSRAWARRATPGTDEAKSFEQLVTKSGFKVPRAEETAAKQATVAEAILAKPEYAKIGRQFDALRGKKPYDPDWYVPCGPTSVRKIAEDVGMLVWYPVFYSNWSQSMHSSGFFDHVYTDSKGTTIEQIRCLKRLPEVLRNVFTISYDMFATIVTRYRTGELENFRAKYLSEWRARTFNFPEVKIDRSCAEGN